MKTNRMCGVFAMVWLLAMGQPIYAKTLCAETDKACQEKASTAHPIRLLSSWKDDLSKPLVQRIRPASEGMVEYITLDNQLHGFAERPRAAQPKSSFMADFTAAFNGLPQSVTRLLESRLVGIQLVDDLGGTGYTDYVYDSQRKVVAAFVVFDTKVLQRMTANTWATWKESTPFKPESGYRLTAKIEEPAHDNLKNSLQYILLHELAHVISVGRSLHPQWDTEPKSLAPNISYPYFDQSWEIDAKANRYRSRFDADFAQRKDVVYYKTAKLSAADMVATYANLERINFPTLYAATNPLDDFAEAFANYVHVVLMKRPWQITLYKDGQVAKVVNPCWEEARCAPKRKIIENLLQSGSDTPQK